MWKDEDFLFNFQAIEQETGESVGAQIRKLLDERDSFGEKAAELEEANKELIRAYDALDEAYKELEYKYYKIKDENELLLAEIRELKDELRGRRS